MHLCKASTSPFRKDTSSFINFNQLTGTTKYYTDCVGLAYNAYMNIYTEMYHQTGDNDPPLTYNVVTSVVSCLTPVNFYLTHMTSNVRSHFLG